MKIYTIDYAFPEFMVNQAASPRIIARGPLYMFVYIFRGRATDTGFEFLRSIGTTFVETLF